MNENPFQTPESNAPFPENAILDSRKPDVKPSRGIFTLTEVLVVIAILGILFCLLFPARRGSSGAARRTVCSNNLRHIVSAVHQYHDVHGEFPSAWTVDSAGNRLHSWRTLILPYLDEQQLYDSIDLAKPWNDPANGLAYNTAVHIYQCPSINVANGETSYLANLTANGLVTDPNAAGSSRTVKPDSETIVIVEFPAKYAVHWMAPRDADQKMLEEPRSDDPENPHSGMSNVAYGDGSVSSMDSGIFMN